MSKAEELLSTLTVDSDATLLGDASTEPHFIIGNDRFISVPNELKRIAVQYDHDVETVTFDCPRYWDGLDMSEMHIYINYLRVDKETGIYKAQNITVDPDDSSIMHFDWTISRNVTEINGQIVFLVCIKKTDADGNEKNHWNSELCKSCSVSEGLEIAGEELKAIYPDVIEQWYQEVLGVIDEVNAVKQGLIDMRDSGELDGATFTPSVSSDGDLSWTNDRGRENPETVNVRGPNGISPVIQVTDIQGGHRITITDVNGTRYVDVKDTIIDPTEAAQELIDDLFVVSTVEPETGPVLWFDPVDDVNWSDTIDQPSPVWAQIQAMIGNLEDLDTTAKNNLVAAVNEAIAKGGEALDNRVKKFYTGNLGAVNIADSDDGAVRNLVIGGKCEQLQTAGINLYHNFNTGQVKETSGIKFTTVENDGISVVGTSVATANSSGPITPYLSNLSDGKRYTCRTFCDDVTGMFSIKKADGSTSYLTKFVYDSGEIVSVYPYFEVSGGVTIDTVIYPMVCEEAYVSQPYEPYTGGAPSPSPEYPQEIRSVENCTVTISNADGTETQTAPIPVTLRGIGDVRDELYVYADGTGKLVQRVGSYTISGLETWITHSDGVGAYTLIDLGQKKTNDIGGVFSHFKMGSINQRDGNAFIKGDSIQIRIDSVSTRAELKTWLAEHQVSVIFDLDAPIETTLTAEQVKALFDLRTYYGGTNVSYESDNGVEPVVNFDYACALDNFVEYIKAAQGDDRKFIYDMDERMTDAEYVAALAYVNSEYAAALTELEV